MKTDTRIIEHGHPLYMGMFTDEGNILVANAVNLLIYNAITGEMKRTQLRESIEHLFTFMTETGYGEVYDTEVRAAVAARLNKELCKPMGWVGIDYFFDDES